MEKFNNSINSMLNKLTEKTEGSNDNMKELVNIIRKLAEDFKAFVINIMNTKDTIANISMVTDVINSIAEQTNLLALNAAIK